MNAGQRGCIERVLWPADGKPRASVWAVLDCARDVRIHPALISSRLDFRCLYSGRLPAELERVAPQLVELLPDHRLLDTLLGDGWGQSWGVFVKIEDPSALRHHLRKFLKVRDEDGRRLIFRYYDPRVLRTYLPSCTGSELATLFGPMAAWLTEGERGESLIEFTQGSAGLMNRHHPVAKAAA